MHTQKRSYQFQVQPQDVDFQGRSTVTALGNILLSAANFNADDNGFGMRRLNEAGCAWVLTKLAIEMHRFPLQYEEVRVETWVESVDRLTTTRNFCIRDKEGAIIGNAGSHWVMIDINTRRPKDLHTLEGIQSCIDDEPGLIEKPGRLVAFTGVLLDSFRVKYSDIDINVHTNSVRYIEWISNCFSLDTYRRQKIKRFEIHYIAETLFDEQLELFGEEPTVGDFRFEIRKQDKAVCRARVAFENA